MLAKFANKNNINISLCSFTSVKQTTVNLTWLCVLILAIWFDSGDAAIYPFVDILGRGSGLKGLEGTLPVDDLTILLDDN